MKRMHDIQAKEGAVVIDGNPLPSGGKMYLHYVSLYLYDEQESKEYTTYLRIICSESEAFASFAEMLAYAMARPSFLESLVVSDDHAEGDYAIRRVSSYDEESLIIDGGCEWHTTGAGVPEFNDTVSEL